jgi:hypothetical protein
MFLHELMGVLQKSALQKFVLLKRVFFVVDIWYTFAFLNVIDRVFGAVAIIAFVRTKHFFNKLMRNPTRQWLRHTV